MIHTTNPDYIREQMKLMAFDRAEKYKPILIPRFFPLTALKEETYLGSFAWSLPKSGLRYIIESKALDLWGVPQTPSEVARDYITVKYPKKLRARKAQIEQFKIHRSAPLYAKRGNYRDYSYVDLRAAYWSIISAVGWDCDYSPSKYLARRSDVRDFPAKDHKVSRNCLVSSGLGTTIQIWTGSEITTRKIGNKHPNLGVYCLCMDILASIASEALDFGGVYVHTDGYILPSSQVNPFIANIERWGLTAGVKYRGDTTIYGPGTYDIGDHKSQRRHIRMTRDTDQVRRFDHAFLKEEFSKHALSRR